MFLSTDENDDGMLFLDYSRKSGVMLEISGAGGMKYAKAVAVERSNLLRGRIVLDYDVRCNSYIGVSPHGS